MENDIDTLFDRRISFPDPEAKDRLERLVGIDDAKHKISKSMGILLNPKGVKDWADKFHPSSKSLLNLVARQTPLVILAGDVGTGKTELASTVGDMIARDEKISVTLFPLSLSTRGSGMVGEMTKLLSTAFEETVKFASSLKNEDGKTNGAVILLVDEADAIVQSRENAQMHHEDRAGVNAFIRGVDLLAEKDLPAAVILCTNRLSAIDPAVQRRATQILRFERPNEEQRRAMIANPLGEAGLTGDQISRVVELTGATDDRAYGFTYSDISQRLLPAMVLNAYPEKAIIFEDVMSVISSLHPTPPFQD